jgi:hypothetical protein
MGGGIGGIAAAAAAAKDVKKEESESQAMHPQPDLYEVYGSVANFNGTSRAGRRADVLT